MRLPALLLLAALLGCDSGSGGAARSRKAHQFPSAAPLKLAFVTNNTSEFWNIARKGIQKAEAELGIQVDVKMPNPAKVNEQRRILEDLESQGYHGVAISVLHPTSMNRQLNHLASKMNLITHDSDAPQSNRLVYIGTNNFQAGELLGEEVVKILPQGGKMAVFVGTFSADNARQRLDGLLKAIADAGVKVTIEARKEDNKDSNQARRNVEDVLNAHPGLDLMVGLWAYNGPAIAAALKAAGKARKIRVVCFDEEEPTLQAIKDGVITCTIVQKPYEFGYLSSKLLKRLCTEGEAALPEDELHDTGVTVIDAENVEEFWAQLRHLKT